MIQEKQIIGFEFSGEGKDTFSSCNPTTEKKNEIQFYKATENEVNRAAEKAAYTFPLYYKKAGTDKAAFLEAITEEIMNAGENLAPWCMETPSLPPPTAKLLPWGRPPLTGLPGLYVTRTCRTVYCPMN